MNACFECFHNSIERARKELFAFHLGGARKCPIFLGVEVCENKISKIQHNIVNTVLFNKNWFKIIIIFCSTFRFTIITILQMGE